MAQKRKSEKELIETAKIIVDRQFPGEWETFMHNGLDMALNQYFLLVDYPDADPDAEFETFKCCVFEMAKSLHENGFI